MGTASPLTLPFVDLRRGPVTRSWRVEDPRALWPDLPADFETVEIDVEVHAADRGGARVKGELRASATLECRRCLAPVRREIETSLRAWFRTDELADEAEEGMWPLDPAASELDLTDAVREELWLAAPAWALCSPDCPGLCPRCGARLAEGPCGCPDEPPDVRWAELEKLRAILAPEGEG